MKKIFLTVGIAILLIFVLTGAYFLPPVRWRVDEWVLRIKYTLNPPQSVVFVPGSAAQNQPVSAQARPDGTLPPPAVYTATPAATRIINLILSDVGRPVGHLVANLVGYDRLVADMQAVLETLVPKEVEVRTTSGAWYLLRIRPYRTQENVIEGAVITFTEITEMKTAQAALRESEALRFLAAVVRDANDAVLVQDLEGRILVWNPGAERVYGWSEAEALAMNIRELVPEGQREKSLTMVKQLARAEVLEPYRLQRIAKDGRMVDVWLTATALVNATGEAYAVVTTERTRREQDE